MNSLFIFAALFGVATIYAHPGPHKYEIGSHNYEMSAMREIELQNSGSSEALNYIDIHRVPKDDASKIPEGAQGAIIKNKRGLWPNKLVWYSFDNAFGQGSRQKVRDALKGIEKVTCIRFKEYVVGRDAKPAHYVRVHSGSGCWSYIGYATFGGKGFQDMSLREPGCVNEKIIQHEFIHALGAFHEQSRNDRDNYIKLFKENMVDGAWGQFEKQTLSTIDSRGSPYDGKSIMHYSNYAFSKNGQPTIQWKSDPNYRLGGTKLSESDIIQLNLLYSCRTNPPTTTTTPKTTTTTPKTTTTTPKTTKTTTTITTTTEKPGECKNKKAFCSRINKSWCRYDGVKDDCPETCGLCDKTTTTTPMTTTTTPMTTKTTPKTTTTTTKGPSGNGCIDVSNHCFKSYTNCDYGIYQRRCRKACDQCDQPLPTKCQGLSDSSAKCPTIVRAGHGACSAYRNHCQLSCCLRDRN